MQTMYVDKTLGMNPQSPGGPSPQPNPQNPGGLIPKALGIAEDEKSQSPMLWGAIRKALGADPHGHGD